MAATHEELQTLLKGLEADVPWLMKAYPDPTRFIHAFADLAGLITGNLASAEDNAWISIEIGEILTKFGYGSNSRQDLYAEIYH